MSTIPNILAIPASLLSFSVLTYVESDDLLSLRSTTKRFRALLHESEESDVIWRRCLARDFRFDVGSDDADGVGRPGASTRPEGRAFRGDFLSTLRVASEEEEILRGSEEHRGDPVYDPGADDVAPRSAARSAFGRTALDGVFRASSPFESWRHWRKASNRFYELPRDAEEEDPGRKKRVRNVHGPYFLRAAAMWAKIERWCESAESGDVGQRILNSLEPGSLHRDTIFANGDGEDEEGLLACQAIHAFYAGQNSEDPEELFNGLMGGCWAYDKVCCTRLLDGPSSSALRMYASRVPFAASFTGMKIFDVDVKSGQLRYRVNRRPQSAVAENLSLDPSESALVWMEEHASRLERGSLDVGCIYNTDPRTQGILMYPQLLSMAPTASGQAPAASRAVTRGVEVVASAVFTPQFASNGGIAHIYSIRIRLLMPGEDGYVPLTERGFETCQLASRHWRIDDHVAGTSERVDGEGVIGFYPLLKEGGYRPDRGRSSALLFPREAERPGTFRYQSCTGPTQGSFRGHMRFVPGSLRSPTGESFDVELAPFALDMDPTVLY